MLFWQKLRKKDNPQTAGVSSTGRGPPPRRVVTGLPPAPASYYGGDMSEDWYDKGYDTGYEDGEKAGRKEGHAEGYEEGKGAGRQEAIAEAVIAVQDLL